MTRSPILSAALAGVITAGSSFGDIVKPVSVTSSIVGDAGSSVDYLLTDNEGFAANGLVDESLIAITIDTGDTLQKAVCSFGELSGGGHAESWTRPTGLGNPVFVFDLTGGGDTAIGSIVLWQYGNNGGGYDRIGNHTRDFELIFHTEAEGDTFDFGAESVEFNGTMKPGLGPGPDANTTIDNPAQLFLFGAQETARYVALRIANNYLPPVHPDINFGGDRYGLGEVRFATEAVVDPEIVLPDGITIENNGSLQTVQVTIANNGPTQDLTVTNAVVTGTDAAEITVITDFSTPLVIGPGLSADIDLQVDGPTLLPILFGDPIEALLEVDSDGWFKPTVTAPISGSVRDPWIDTVDTIELGTILPTPGTKTFVIDVKNLGANSDLTIDNALFTDFEFSVEDDLNTTPLVIPPGGTGQINLSFDSGGAAGDFTGTLEIDSDDPGVQLTRFVDVTITVERDPEISVPAEVTIGPFAAGSGPHTFSVQIDNVGASNDLVLSPDPVPFGGNETNFSVDTFDASIAAAGNGNINLTFDPMGAAGTYITTLEIESNDLGAPLTEVQIVANVDPAPAPGDLVAWWPLDDDLAPGTDGSGNGFHGVETGIPILGAGANANTGNSMLFDSTTVINVPWSGYLNPASFTVTLWALPTAAGGGSYRSPITSRDDSPGATQGFVLYNDNAGNWTFWTGDGDPGWHNTTSGGTVATNVWTHLAISYDAATQTKSIYVNGTLADSATAPPNLYAPNGPQMEELHIGGGADDGTQFRFEGNIDDVALFASALGVGDINTIMNNGVAGFLNPAAQAMKLIANGYSGGNLSLSIDNIPGGETFHLRGSTDGQGFSPLTSPIDFDSSTAQPILVPGTGSILLLQAYEGPSVP